MFFKKSGPLVNSQLGLSSFSFALFSPHGLEVLECSHVRILLSLSNAEI